MQVWFATSHPSVAPQTAEHIRQLWHDGGQFKFYMVDGYYTINDTVRLRMASVTHLDLVYQDSSGEFQRVNVELK